MQINDNLHARHLVRQMRSAKYPTTDQRSARWPTTLSSAVGKYRVMTRTVALNPANLHRRGYVYRGGGYYSSVYRHPHAPGVVFKVPKERRDTDGWYMYAQFVLSYAAQHGYCSIMPRIHHLQAGDGPRAYSACLEELIQANSYQERLAFIATDYLTGITEAHEVLEALPEYVDGDAPACMEFLEAMRQFVDASMVPLDLHSGNVMVRAGSSVVITDPFLTPEALERYD